MPRGGARYAEDNGRWNGGVMISQGYRLIKMPDHPNANKAGYVREHVLVMSRKLGRKIDSKREIVHHIDGNRQHNDETNLVITNRAEHAREHHIGVKKPTSRENIMRWNRAHAKTSKDCIVCGKPFIYGSRKTQVCCSKSCAGVQRGRL